MSKKPTLLQQVLIEEKRNQLRVFKADYNPKIKHTKQMEALLPNIKWKPKQAAFINAHQFMKWYLGGYKSGKTFTGVGTDTWLSYINRPYPGILVHPTFDGLRLTILPLIEEICDLNHILYEVKELSTKFKVTYKFGKSAHEWGTLYLASGHIPKSLKGPKYAFGHIDEPLIMKAEITEVIMSRLAELRAKLRWLLFTGTPEPEHMLWGWDIVDKIEEDSDTRFLITMSAREVAEYLAPGYIEEQIKHYTPEQAETFIDGKYRNLSGGKVYSSFDRQKNMRPAMNVKNFMVDENNEIVLSFDFNVNQMSCALHRLSGTYKLLEKEFRIQSRSDTRELCVLIINRIKEDGYVREDGMTKFGKSFLITGDASGQAHSSKSNQSDYEIIVQEFERAKIKISVYVPEANPAVRDRTNYINLQFENETYILSDDCNVNIRDRELTSWVMGAKGFMIDKSKSELTHMSDAADYGIYNTQMLTDIEGGMGVTTVERSSRR